MRLWHILSLLIWSISLLAAFGGAAKALTRPAGEQAVAAGRYERFRRVIIEVAADPKFAGQHVRAEEGQKTLGSARLALSGRDAAATLVLPMPPLGKSYGSIEIKTRRLVLTAVTLPDAELARHEALYGKRLRFLPYLFDSDRLPGCDFEDPAGVEDLIGRYDIKVRYLDAAGNEVTTAALPGRYGAVVEVTGETGWKHRGFATLYRAPQRVNWQLGAGPKVTCLLPEALGIDPAVAAAQTQHINDFARETTVRGLLVDDDRGAVLLAGLHEQAGDPRQANDDWWFAQRKRLGLIEHRYETVLPQGYADHPEQRYPLLVFLHGAGECGLEVTRVRVHGPWQFLAAHPEYECLLVGPQCDPYGSAFGTWTGQTRELNDLIEHLQATYRVDPDRIYLTGLSLGGFGTWAMASAYPEQFAAAAPICGGGNPEQIARMKSVPTWAFHGAKDSVVPLSWGQTAVNALKAAGGDVRFTIYPEAGHDSWTETYNNPEFYAWLFAQKRGRTK
jgi:pimeloyl-ACP methyl ester carboxylesterase